MARRDLVAWTYQADNGGTWVTRADDWYVSQVDGVGDPLCGGAPATWPGAYEPLPANLHPRAVWVADPTGLVWEVVVYATDAPLWTGSATSITTRDRDGNTYTASVYSRTGERRHGPGA